MATPSSVLFVCLGNICRSPLAEGLFLSHVHRAHGEGVVTADSAGTSGWHEGEPPDPGSVAVARRYGIDIQGQRSRPVRPVEDTRFDWVVAMDRRNLAWLRENLDLPEDRVVLMRRFDLEDVDPDVPDPYGQGPEGFELVYRILDRSMPGLIDAVLASRNAGR